MKQIKDYLGKQVKVEVKNGNFVYGTLCFYHFDAQVVHIEEFTMYFVDGTTQTGHFKVLNNNEWISITINGGEKNENI